MKIKRMLCGGLAAVLLAVSAGAVGAAVRRPVISVVPYGGRELIRWTMPDDTAVDTYTVTVTDTKGYGIREWKGIVKESNSVLLKGLMPDFAFTVTVKALDKNGTELYRGSLRSSTDRATDNQELVTFTVTYNTPVGSLFGFESEEVIFGQTPKKAPNVILPDNCVFVGWSVDGDTVIDPEDYNVYADTELIAVIAQQ